jgi:short subunit dehydrogenase-like uncharacterized protein
MRRAYNVRMQWMIYGANGYTGELIAREAAKRGQRPILAGRSRAAIESLARELDLEFRIVSLDDHAAMVETLRSVSTVLHCAGPFSRTSAPMVAACLESGTNYLDITGELAVFEANLARTDAAQKAGIAIISGVGFDVVPTDCLAAMLGDALPSATELLLAFFAPGASVSKGTATTMVESMHEAGAIRRDGRIVRVPFAYDIRDIPYSSGSRPSMTIPWGDISTAYHTTHIPNIRVYSGASRKSIAQARRFGRFLPLLGRAPFRQLLQYFASRRQGPDASRRASGRTYLWGSASDGKSTVSATMETPEGYAFTVLSALAAVERVQGGGINPGAWTPSRAFGIELLREIDGVTISELSRSNG